MSPRVKCAVCGHENELKRLFCSKCGYRLNLSHITAGREGGGGVLRFLARLVRLVFLLAVVGGLGLLLWPVSPLGARGSEAYARQMKAKMQTLSMAVDAGQFIVEIVTEEEANGYLAALLQRDRNATRSQGFRLALGEINLAFKPADFVVVILANWGPLRLSYEITGAPSVGDQGFGVRVLGARWGHLPLPGPAAEWMTGRLAGVFARMELERKVLDRLGRVELGQGRMLVATRSR